MTIRLAVGLAQRALQQVQDIILFAEMDATMCAISAGYTLMSMLFASRLRWKTAKLYIDN